MIHIQHLVDSSSGLTRPVPFLQQSAVGVWAHASERPVDARCPMPPGNYGDIIVLHIGASWSRLPFLALLREDCRGRPLVLIERSYSADFENQCVVNRQRFHALLSLTYRLVDYVVVATSAQRTWLLQSGLVAPAKIVQLAPDGLDPAVSMAATIEPDAAPPFRVGFWGALTAQSGVDVLINAFKLLPDGKASLDIYGCGEDRAEVAKLVLGHDHIRLVCARSDDMGVLQKCPVFAFPSRWQPCSLHLRSAMLAGCALIISDISDLDSFADSQAVETARGDTPLALAEAILRMSQRPLGDVLQAARATGAEWRLQSYQGWQDMITKIVEATP